MIQNSDMFKKIKSLFIVEGPADADTQTDEEVNVVETTQSSSKAAAPNNQVNINTTISDGQPDQKFTDLLLRAIESNNMDGFDYLEYKNSLKSIEQVIPDEAMRYKSAFEMAKTMGLTKEKLIQSASHYQNILVSEEKKFKDAVENQKSKQIQGRTDQIQSFEKSITEKQQLIEKLLKEIEVAKTQLDTFRKEINDAVVKIDTTNQQFVASYNLVQGQIMQDIEKIKNNL